MPFCTNCGSAVDGNDYVCPSCGQPMKQSQAASAPVYTAPEAYQAQQAAYQAPVNPQNYQAQAYQPQQQYAVAPATQDKGSFGWAVLGFFIPIVGLILWLAWKGTRPNDAKKAGKGALIGFIVGMVLSIVSTILTCTLFQNIDPDDYLYNTTTPIVATNNQDPAPAPAAVVTDKYVGTWNAHTFSAPDMGTYSLADLGLNAKFVIDSDGTITLYGNMFDQQGISDTLQKYGNGYALFDPGETSPYATFTMQGNDLKFDVLGSIEDQYTLLLSK